MLSNDYSYLQPGDILLFKIKKDFDIWGKVITSEERDTDVCHATIIGHRGFVWSTGVKKKFGVSAYFGAVKFENYLPGRSFYVCRLDNLSPVVCGEIMDTTYGFTGQVYGMWKVLLLTQKAKFGGIVRRLYPWLTKVVKNPFCSESVAYSYWQAGIRICENMGKEEPSAITPANIKAYAQMKGTPLNIVHEIDQ